MTTLVAGAGAVGAHVAARLQECGESLVLYDVNPRLDFLGTIFDVSDVQVVGGDIRDMDLLVRTLRKAKVDRIVHLASLLTRQLTDDPHAGVTVNMLGTGVVLEAARLAGISRVVFASTRGVNELAARAQEGATIDEDFEFRVLSDRPKTMYELSKLAGEWLGLLYNDRYGVDFVAMRLAGGFGPTPGPPSGLTGRVLRALVYDAALGKDVTISDPALSYGGKHEFIYFKDDAEAIMLACFAENPRKRVYNIRIDAALSYEEVVATVASIFPDVSITIDRFRESSMSPGRLPREDLADTTTAKGELGWRWQYDLGAGIRDWSEWIRRTQGRF